MNYIKHPVVNDPVYGYNRIDDKDFGQMLHAKELGFIHPITHEFMDFQVDAPKKFYEIIEMISKLDVIAACANEVANK